MDTDQAIHGGITRNADGTINMNGYLELTAAVPDGVGARMSGMASKAVTLPDLVVEGSDDKEDADNSGNDSNDDDSTAAEVPAQSTVQDAASVENTTDMQSAGKNTRTQSGKSQEIVKKLVVDKDMDWDEVNEALRELIVEAAGGKAVLEVELGRHYKLSADVLVALMGTNITLRLQQSNGVLWEIDGKDITNAMAADMRVELNSNAIPTDKLEIFRDFDTTIQLSLDHSGVFGFKATMRFPTGGGYNGKYANLFWYHDGAFEWIGSSKVADGYAEFMFDHASDYVVVIADVEVTDVPQADANTEADGVGTEDTAVNAETVENAGTTGEIWTTLLIILVVLAAGVCAIVVVAMRRKKEQ